MPKLSDTRIRAAKPKQKPYKLFDQDGLFMVINPSGGRWWRQRYFQGGKEKLLSLGTYPEFTLSEARERSAVIRKQVANGIDPSKARREVKVASTEAQAHTVKAVVAEWMGKFSKAEEWSADHLERTRRRFEVNVYPWLGHKGIAEVTEGDILKCLQRVEDRGALDTAHRLLAQFTAVLRYAKKRRYIEHNPAAELTGSDTLPRPKVKHHAGITDPKKLGPLLRAIDGYYGGFVVRCALRLQPLIFVRPGELRHADWAEFTLDSKEPEWRIPAEKMKMREQHIVPLSRQAVAILKELHPLTGETGYVFPSMRDASRPISENTLNMALKALGYGTDQQTPHGFRSTASTLLNELGWKADAIERQLAHGERDKIRGAYNFAEYLPERRKMMASWADYLDELKAAKA